MAITNPTKYVSVQRLQRFESKLAQKYQTQAIAAITGLSAETVEAALAELLGKIQALPSAIVPKGTRTFSQLAPATVWLLVHWASCGTSLMPSQLQPTSLRALATASPLVRTSM